VLRLWWSFAIETRQKGKRTLTQSCQHCSLYQSRQEAGTSALALGVHLLDALPTVLQLRDPPSGRHRHGEQH